MSINYARLGDLPIEAVTDGLTEHYESLPIHDQVRRDLRATWIQQPTDVEFNRAAREAVRLTKPYPATPDLFDGLIAAIEEMDEPSGWDRLEDWLTFEWRSWMGWALCLTLGGVFGLIGYGLLVTA